MRNGLLILPFLSLLTVAVFSVLASAYSGSATLFNLIGLGLATTLLAIWVFADWRGFKAFFARKGAKYGASSGVVILLAIGMFIGAGVITSRPRFDKTIDLSRDKTSTLSDQSVKIIETLNKSGQDLSVLAFFNEDAQEQGFRDLIGLYTSKGAKFSVKYINPEKDPLQANAEKLTSANTVIFRLGGRENRVTTFTEEKITNALIGVLKEGSKKIYFTTGHGEGQLAGQDAGGFEIISQELKNNRFDVAEINLLETGKVPDDATTVVISGPKYDLKDAEVTFLEDFISRGGSLLTMVDALVPISNINKLLSKYGITFNNDFMLLRPDDPRAQLLGHNNAMVGDFDEFNSITKDFAKKNAVALLFQNTRTISENTDNAAKFKVSLIGKTVQSTTVRVKNAVSQNDLKGITQERIEQGAFAVMATASGKAGEKDVRIVAYGSAQIANNRGAQSPENRDLISNTVSWLTQDDDFIAIRPRDVTKSTLTITSSQSMINLLFISYVYPFLFLGFGTYYWLRRRQA
jgi:hypothetical protein